MKMNIVQIGNSKGVRIPKALLKQLHFEKAVELEVLPDGLLLRPVQTQTSLPARAGWDEMFKSALAESGDDSDAFADWNQSRLTDFDEKDW